MYAKDTYYYVYGPMFLNFCSFSPNCTQSLLHSNMKKKHKSTTFCQNLYIEMLFADVSNIGIFVNILILCISYKYYVYIYRAVYKIKTLPSF